MRGKLFVLRLPWSIIDRIKQTLKQDWNVCTALTHNDISKVFLKEARKKIPFDKFLLKKKGINLRKVLFKKETVTFTIKDCHSVHTRGADKFLCAVL